MREDGRKQKKKSATKKKLHKNVVKHRHNTQYGIVVCLVYVGERHAVVRFLFLSSFGVFCVFYPLK